MRLVVRFFSPNDVGTYHCVSTNSLGRADGTMRLYGELMGAIRVAFDRPNFIPFVAVFFFVVASLSPLTFRDAPKPSARRRGDGVGGKYGDDYLMVCGFLFSCHVLYWHTFLGARWWEVYQKHFS